MKICMVVPQADVKGGIATVVNGYREIGLGEGYEISFVESYCNGSKWKKLWKAVCGYMHFGIELLIHKPDIVHVHSSFGPSFYRKMPFVYMTKWRKIKLVNHIHGAEFEEFYSKASEKKKKLIRNVYGKCDALVVLSSEWKEKIGRIVSEDKIEIIENYCHIPEMDPKTRKKQILFLGEIGERKGCYDIPEIYNKIVNEVGEIPFIMAGEGSVEQVKEMLKKRGVLKSVSFPGWLRGEEKKQALQESTYFLFPSYNEGMPMAVLEAMAYGMGIVTTNVGGIPKLIEDGIDGYICIPGDNVDIADKMIRLIKKQELVETCGKNARKRAIELYSFESHVNKLKQLYTKI